MVEKRWDFVSELDNLKVDINGTNEDEEVLLKSTLRLSHYGLR